MVYINLVCGLTNKNFKMAKEQAELDKQINNINICPDAYTLLYTNVNVNYDFFKIIDIPEKAYLLGLFYHNIAYKENKTFITINNFKKEKDSYLLKIIKCFGNDFKHEYYSSQCMFKLIFTINDNTLNDILNQYNDFFNFKTDELRLSFIRGFYEGSKTSLYTDIYLNCSGINEENLKKILNFINIPYHKNENKIIFEDGCNSVDFLGKIYNNCGDLNISFYNQFKENPYCKVYKTNENAIVPSKSRESDAGYDLTIIKLSKEFNKKTKLYDTGIKIELKNGYYAEVVPRSSLSKSGYMLANSIGIIDNSYRGNIYIALTKINEDSPDIELPFRCCQLIIKKQYRVNMIEVDDDLEITNRNEGGFGSTN